MQRTPTNQYKTTNRKMRKTLDRHFRQQASLNDLLVDKKVLNFISHKSSANYVQFYLNIVDLQCHV